MSDIEETPSAVEAPVPVNGRKRRSAAQQEAFERARALRAQNVAKRKAEREAEKAREKARVREEKARERQLKKLRTQYSRELHRIPAATESSSDDEEEELQTAQKEAPVATKEPAFVKVDMDQLARGVASHLTTFFSPPPVKQAVAAQPPLTIRYI